MSTVYKALDRQRLATDDPHPYVALKLLKPRFAASREHLGALRNEAESARGLDHPHIVKVYDVHRDGQAVFLLMEYLNGEPLSHQIREPGFQGWPAKRVLPIIEKVAEALAYAHAHSVVHCDVKPASIFLTRNGEIKLFDFGLARRSSNAVSVGQAADDSVDAPGEAVTLAYSSPERIEGQPADPRDDVFSLACTAYELLTGTHPFGYQSALDAREAQAPVPWRRGLSFIQWRALRRGLDFKRAARTESVARLLTELRLARMVLDRLPAVVSVVGIASVLLGAAVVLLHGSEKPQGAAAVLAKPAESSQGTHQATTPGARDTQLNADQPATITKDESRHKSRAREPAVR